MKKKGPSLKTVTGGRQTHQEFCVLNIFQILITLIGIILEIQNPRIFSYLQVIYRASK
jgi:hypothetical protein